MNFGDNIDFKDLERVSFGAVGGEEFIGGDPEMRKLFIEQRKYASDEDKFIKAVSDYLIRFRAENNSNKCAFFTNKDSEEILSYIPSIENIKYKNPLGFVLGYYVLNERQKILKNRLKNLKSLCSDEDITPEDVIRYARYWQNLLKDE